MVILKAYWRIYLIYLIADLHTETYEQANRIIHVGPMVDPRIQSSVRSELEKSWPHVIIGGGQNDILGEAWRFRSITPLSTLWLRDGKGD